MSFNAPAAPKKGEDTGGARRLRGRCMRRAWCVAGARLLAAAAGIRGLSRFVRVKDTDDFRLRKKTGEMHGGVLGLRGRKILRNGAAAVVFFIEEVYTVAES